MACCSSKLLANTAAYSDWVRRMGEPVKGGVQRTSTAANARQESGRMAVRGLEATDGRQVVSHDLACGMEFWMCGCSSMVEPQLPKLMMPVRFWSPAPDAWAVLVRNCGVGYSRHPWRLPYGFAALIQICSRQICRFPSPAPNVGDASYGRHPWRPPFGLAALVQICSGQICRFPSPAPVQAVSP